jgi:hypothetical protein
MTHSFTHSSPTSNTALLIPARDCLFMPLNMKLSFAHSNVAAVEGAWPVMGFTSHQHMHGGPSGRVVQVLPHSPLASRHSHTSEIAPKWASGSTWFGWVFIESAGAGLLV